MSNPSIMKAPLFVFILFFGSAVFAQRITNIFVDLGMNHSGIIYTNNIFTDIDRKDFKTNFNPNFSGSAGIELQLNKKFNLITGLGYRTTGTLFKLPETTVLQPDGTGRLIDTYYHFNQVTLPLLLGYNFFEKFKLKPILGLVNNYNVSINAKTENYKGSDIEKYYNKYSLNGLVGLMFYNEQLFNSKLGLGMKISYEKNLMDIDNNDNSTTNQNIVSASVLFSYKLLNKD